MEDYIKNQLDLLSFYKQKDGSYLMNETILTATFRAIYSMGMLEGFRDAQKIIAK